jgi:hypothetical protein
MRIMQKLMIILCQVINQNLLATLSTHMAPFLFLSVALQPFGPWLIFSFLTLYTVSRTPWTGDQPIARPLPTHDNTNTE